MFRKASGIYFIENRVTGQQKSLKTRDREAAVRIFNAQNEAHEQPAINLQIARAYLMASDPLVVRRTWQHAMDEIVKTKQGSTQARWLTGIKDKAFDSIRKTPLIETQAEHLLNVLSRGTVSTNVHLRKLHNFCLDMNWLPWPVVPKRQWPQVRFKEKRAITFEEHQAILAREQNPERKAYYQLCWFIGGSQGDIAQLLAEDVDWEHSTLSFRRRKTGVPVVIRLGQEASSLLKDLPSEGPLVPVPVYGAVGRSRHRVSSALQGLGHRRREPAQLSLRVGRARQGGGLSGALRHAGAGSQFRGRASQLCQGGADDDTSFGGIPVGAAKATDPGSVTGLGLGACWFNQHAPALGWPSFHSASRDVVSGVVSGCNFGQAGPYLPSLNKFFYAVFPRGCIIPVSPAD